MAKKGRSGNIQRKVVAAILLVGIIPGIIVVVLAYLSGIDTLKNSIGGNFKEMAKETADKIQIIMNREIRDAHGLALSPYIRSTTAGYKQTPNILSGVSGERPSDVRLREYLAKYQKHGMWNYSSVIVTDMTGNVLAATRRPDNHNLRRANWWITAFNRGDGRVFVDGIDYDDITQSYSVAIAVPIMDLGNERAIGVLKINHDVDDIFKTIINIKIGNTGHANLVTSDGTLVVCPIFPPKSHSIDKKLMEQIMADKPGWGIAKDDAHGGMDSIIGFAPVLSTLNMGSDNFGGKAWYIFIRQSPEETYAPMHALLWKALFWGLGLLILLSTLGFYAGKRIVRPIILLTRGAALFGHGHLDHRISVKTNDEIEQLADSFNAMANNLEKSGRERERYLRRLEESEEQYKILFDNAEDSMMMVDLNGKIIAYNKREEGILGFSREMLVSHDFKEFLSGEDGETFDGLFALTLGGGKPPTAEVTVKKRDGGILVMEIDLTGVKKHDRIDFVQIHLRDVTKRKELEQQVMLERVAALDHFLSSLVHDLRNPIMGIKKRLEALRSGMDHHSAEEVNRVLTDVISGSGLLLGMVNDVLDVYQNSYDRIPLIISPFPLVETMEDAIKLLHMEAEERKVVIIVNDWNSTVEIMGDRRRLQRVFINILDNALKFSPSGGKITVTFEPMPPSAADFLQIKIEDEGPGIPADRLSRIFQPFHRQKGIEDVKTGIGLGLYFCKIVVELHNGDIRAENKPDGGAAFYIKIPVGENAYVH